MAYQRANTSWMKRSMGLSFHWTDMSVNLDGTQKNYQDAVDSFPVEQFADALANAGAQHCIFTLTHGKNFFPCPHPPADKILPGRTCKRDLAGELMRALKTRNIRFILYYNHSCNNGDDPEWKTACGYADGPGHDPDRFAANFCGIVRYLSEQYGNLIDGWWFDSPYSLDPRGPTNSITSDLNGWQFPWEQLVKNAKSGNPDAVVAINGGFIWGEPYTSYFLYTDHVDYYPGECLDLLHGNTPDAVPGIQETRWCCADSPRWVFNRGTRDAHNGTFAPPQFSDEVLLNAFKVNLSADRMITLNILIDQAGKINPEALAQFKRIKKAASRICD